MEADTEFHLSVTFSGLCLFLIRNDCKKVAVLQPDCRVDGRLKPPHPDGDTELGIHHAGYLRFNLANLDPTLPSEHPKGGALFDGVYRFDNEELDFGIPMVEETLSKMTIETNLPAVERIAPSPSAQLTAPLPDCNAGEPSLLQPIPGLLTKEDAPLVMRTFLTEGELKGKGDTNWVIPSVFTPMQPAHSGFFPDEVTWSRKVSGSGLSLTIKPFTGGKEKTITLHPLPDASGAQVIRLQISNLCSDNPLEWREFKAPAANKLDRDFKWLYRLLEPTIRGKPIKELLNGLLLPIPSRGSQFGSGGENCIGLRMNVASFE